VDRGIVTLSSNKTNTEKEATYQDDIDHVRDLLVMTRNHINLLQKKFGRGNADE
jgi:hypothetical protein